jgi:hypothetical protein
MGEEGVVCFNSMEQTPSSEAVRSSSQETLRHLWKSEVHYRVHISPPLVPIQWTPSNENTILYIP